MSGAVRPDMNLAHGADGAVRRHSLIRRLPSKAMPWLPIWVATLASRAALASARASNTVRVSGFSQ